MFLKHRILLSALFFFLTQAVLATNILIIYPHSTGYTSALAEPILKGVLSVNQVQAKSLSLDKVTVDDVLWADGIILGSPVYNANPSPQLLEFIKYWPFNNHRLLNKIGAVFVTSAGYSAGEEESKWSLLRAMMTFGIIIVGSDNWHDSVGLTGFNSEFIPGEHHIPNPNLAERAFSFGARIATTTKKFNANQCVNNTSKPRDVKS
jgi:NAD(P)H dehydrogenase (quinone)